MISFRSRTALAFAAFVSVAASSADAAFYRLQFQGTYNSPQPIFGTTGSGLSASGSFVYDTSLDTDTQAFPAGSPIGPNTAGTGYYGHSASGIILTSVNIGDQSWNANDVNPRTVEVGSTSDLWLNADLSAGNIPTLGWIRFENAGGSVNFGGSSTSGGVDSLNNSFSARDLSPFNEVFSTVQLTVTPIPEPATASVLLLAATPLLARRRKRA